MCLCQNLSVTFAKAQALLTLNALVPEGLYSSCPLQATLGSDHTLPDILPPKSLLGHAKHKDARSQNLN